MHRHFLKFNKFLTNIVCFPLILVSNNSELAAKYLPNDLKRSIGNSEINNLNDSFFKEFEINKEIFLFFDIDPLQ